MTRTCTYHSMEWAELVEQGWTTMSVVNGIATMYKSERAWRRGEWQ